jgi:hypothetical protein
MGGESSPSIFERLPCAQTTFSRLYVIDARRQEKGAKPVEQKKKKAGRKKMHRKKIERK